MPPHRANQKPVTKPVKSGILNSGYEYEKLIPAFFALELLKDTTIQSFELELNSSSFGKFDDLIITVLYTDNCNEQFAIQLKHREEGKNKLNAADEFTRRDNNNKAKGYNIGEYLRAFVGHDKKIRDNYKFVLFTNAEFLHLDKVRDYEIETSSQGLRTKLFNLDGVYKFKKRDHNSDVDLEFHRNFFLVSGQKCVNEIERAILKTFEEDLHSDKRTAICYIDLFQHLHKNDYNNTKIGRDAVILNLANLLLSNSIISPRIVNSADASVKLLEAALKKFDLTILPEAFKECIEINWVHDISQTLESFLVLAQELKFVKKDEVLDEKTSLPLLYFLQEKPLFLHVTSRSEKIIYSIAPLLKSLEQCKIHLVLVGPKVDKDQFQGWKTFYSLEDLAADNTLYQKFLSKITISFQGRVTKTLKDLNKDLTKLISPSELLLTLKGSLLIGKEIESLPDFYIPRPLLTAEVTFDQLEHLTKQKTTIVHCGGYAETFKQYLHSKNLYFVNPRNALILTDEPQVKPNEQFYNHLKLNQGITLQWMESKVYPDKPSTFENQINVLCGDPGIGKTTMMKFLARNCPHKYWVVPIPLQQMNLYFKTMVNVQDVLNIFLCRSKQNETDEKFCRYFLEQKNIVFFLDGLNELDSNSIGLAMRVIEDLAEEGYKLWISCTTFLKHFEVFTTLRSYTIEGVMKQQQEAYVLEKLKSVAIQEEVINQIQRKLFKNSENIDILKVPLILFLLTEILSSHEKISDLEDNFTINQMYASFLEGKLKHNLRKTECDRVLDTLTGPMEAFKNFCLRGYQTWALQICLDQDLFKCLNIKTDDVFLEHVKQSNDFLGIAKVNENDTIVFSHYTFAEYFAAQWLSENFKKIPKTERDFILKPQYEGIRRFFDAKMAESCPLHLAVLNQDLPKVKKYSQSCWNDVDRGGRSALHLIVSMGKKHSDATDNKFTTHEEILKYLLALANTEDLVKKDQFLGWNLYQYADASLRLFSLEQLSKKGDFDRNFLKTNPSILTYSCVTLGYTSLLRLAIKERGLKWLYQQYEEKPLLHLALESNQQDVAVLLIENNADLMEIDSKGLTPLHQAAVWGHTEIVGLLLTKNVDIESKDSLGRTSLDIAARMGHTAIVELLVEKGAKVDTEDRESKTPLQKAAYMGKTEIVKFLISKGAKVNAMNINRSDSLQFASKMGHYETVKCLVDNKADLNSCDKARKTPLHYAVSEGFVEIVQYLVEQGANIFAADDDEKTPKEIALESKQYTIAKILTDAEKQYPPCISPSLYKSELHQAANAGNLETIKRLVETGANLEEVNEDKDTPLHIAAREGHLHLVQFLLSKGVTTAATNYDGRVPLHWACHRGHASVVKLLLNRGQNDARDKWGNTPLHRASYKGHKAVVQILVEAGVDVNCVSGEGTTALHSAARGGHVDVIEYLLSKGADIVKKNHKEETCLHVAVQRGCTEVVDYLIRKHGNIVDEGDYQEQTALHFAAQKGYTNMLQILIRGGADIKRIDKFRQTAMDIAVNAGRGEVMEFLRGYQGFFV